MEKMVTDLALVKLTASRGIQTPKQTVTIRGAKNFFNAHIVFTPNLKLCSFRNL